MEEKERLREIIRHLITNNKEFFDQNKILVGNKGNYWILNYLPGADNEYAKLVRGLVVEKPKAAVKDELSLIKSFPFTRFFNQHEPQAAKVDFKNADMLEKMDGTLVSVSFPSGDIKNPLYHTRKMMSTHQDDMDKETTTFAGQDTKLMREIGPFVKALSFSGDDKYFTYIFEFIHNVSYVLTKYQPEHYGLYLLGARDLRDHRELNEDELDRVAPRLNSKRPRRFDAVADIKDIQKMFDMASRDLKDFEGFVFRDKKTGKRVKVKDPDYVRKHRLIDNTSWKRLVAPVLMGEEDEVVAYFPHVKPRVEAIKNAFHDYIEKTTHTIKFWKSREHSRKDLSYWLTNMMDTFKRRLVLNFSELPDDKIEAAVKDAVLRLALGPALDGEKDARPDYFLELIGIKDNDEEL